MINIIFDLDGTLIDCSDRMYILFNDIAPMFGFNKEKYLNLKRNEVSHKMMFDLIGKGEEYCLFNDIWMNRIEALEYLQFDKLYPNIIESLELLSANNKLMLLTARQYKDRLNKELNQFNLLKYFSEILVANRNNKEELLKSYLKSSDNEKSTVYVSDMGKDIIIGKKMGIKTIAVTYGFMCEDRFIYYAPDYIVNNIELVVDVVKKMVT